MGQAAIEELALDLIDFLEGQVITVSRIDEFWILRDDIKVTPAEKTAIFMRMFSILNQESSGTNK
jgi:hypothetical protein